MKRNVLSILFIALLIFTSVFVALPINVNAATASTQDVWNPSAVTFYGSYTWGTRTYAGNNFYLELRATASDGVTRNLTVTIYVEATNTTYTYRSYTDGYNKITPPIPLNGGSRVRVTVSCADTSVAITVDPNFYSV